MNVFNVLLIYKKNISFHMYSFYKKNFGRRLFLYILLQCFKLKITVINKLLA